MEIKDLKLLETMQLRDGDALLVVDMQYDFMPGGALPVEKGDAFISQVNQVMQRFTAAGLPVVLTQDWHPRGHRSFASAHPGRQPYDPYDAPGLGPVLWPDHCVPGTHGAEFHQDLRAELADAIIRKGYHPEIDSYSGFLENDHQTETGLDGYLRSRGVRRIFVCGLALDYCVFFTAVDGADKGYQVLCLIDLTAPVGQPADSVSRSLETMVQKGVRFLRSDGIAEGPA